jgi:uridine kinase
VIYLIGGPARCGKSTLAKKLRKEIDGQVLAGDAFVRALKQNLKPAWVPDLYDYDVAHVGIERAKAEVDRLRRRDEAMWQFYQAYLETAYEDAPNDDLLLEGNLWPDYMELFELPYYAVYLVDTSVDEQAMRLAGIRDGLSDNNWMQDFTDEKLREWAAFNALRSQRYCELCEANGARCFDIAELGIDGAQQQAFEYLLQKTV